MSYSRVSENMSSEQKILRATLADIDKNKQHYKDIKDFLIKKYKKANGRKQTSVDDDFDIGDDDESENHEKDFLWKTLHEFEKIDLNPKTVYEFALLFKKKADELGLFWSKPIQTDIFTRFYAEPYRKCIIKPDDVDIYEDYLEDIKNSETRMKMIEKWLIKENIKSYELNQDQWLFHISSYYVKNKIQLEDNIVFRPVDKDEKRCFYELKHYSIEYDKIKLKMFELETIHVNTLKTKTLLSKIMKENAILETIHVNTLKTKTLLSKVMKENAITKKVLQNLDIHQYIYLLAKYWLKSKDEFDDDYVFHPKKSKSVQEIHDIDVYSIYMKDIKTMSVHIQNSTSEKAQELVNIIINWENEKNKTNETKKKFSDFIFTDWRSLIKDYYTSNKRDIPQDVVYYPKSKETILYSLNHYVIDHEELTRKFDILDLFDFEESDDDDDDDDNDDDNDNDYF